MHNIKLHQSKVLRNDWEIVNLKILIALRMDKNCQNVVEVPANSRGIFSNIKSIKTVC